MNRKANDVCDEHDLYEIVEVDGNSVSDTAIAETDFGERTIIIPKFNLPYTFWEKFEYATDFARNVITSFRDKYLFRHEAEVEAEKEPINEDEHADFELDMLRDMEKEAMTSEYGLDGDGWLGYLTGLTAHKLRYKNGDKTGFTKKIWGYVRDRIDRYADSIKLIEPVIDEALSPEYSV
jgi:hypothetical protein